MSSTAGKRIGPFLCWAVVFADIGTSQYYVPGILYREVGRTAAAFVLLTGLCFILLARKYVALTARYTEGGGVVSAATDVFGPTVGAVAGMLISVDYFLTSAISSVSGLEYVSSVVPLGNSKLLLTCLALVALGALNILGLKESAIFSAVMAVAALSTSLITGALCMVRAPPGTGAEILQDMASLADMDPLHWLKGFAGAWLAFSGLETISQLSPALRDPRALVARRAMAAVTVTVLLTSPVLTAYSLALLDPAHTNPDHFISELGFVAGGQGLRVLVVISASTLLLFASNTAIIGCYHVFVAVARERFLPTSLAHVSSRYGTPHQAIALAVMVPVLVILATAGSLQLLGELYAFGLLGAFTLSSVSMDVVNWREQRRGVGFLLGVLTTFLVALAWGANVFFKWQATVFGSSLVALGMGLALAVRRGWIRGDMNLVPFLSAEAAEASAEQTPPMRRILSLKETLDLLSFYPSGLLVAVRGFRTSLLDAAVALARERGCLAVHLLCVDEIPGLFYPPKVGPSPDAVRALDQSVRYLEQRGVEAVPIWRMGHDAPSVIAGTARKLSAQVVMVGASERNPLWTVLRGNVLRGLAEKLDPDIQLIVANVAPVPPIGQVATSSTS